VTMRLSSQKNMPNGKYETRELDTLIEAKNNRTSAMICRSSGTMLMEFIFYELVSGEATGQKIPPLRSCSQTSLSVERPAASLVAMPTMSLTVSMTPTGLSTLWASPTLRVSATPAHASALTIPVLLVPVATVA
jgi:hypothetical protein